MPLPLKSQFALNLIKYSAVAISKLVLVSETFVCLTGARNVPALLPWSARARSAIRGSTCKAGARYVPLAHLSYMQTNRASCFTLSALFTDGRSRCQHGHTARTLHPAPPKACSILRLCLAFFLLPSAYCSS